MTRKKWTPKEDVTELDIRTRDKKKWQLALRRYVLEKQVSENYAPYFGLDIESFREWIEIQFTEDLNWESFGSKWQFDHIVPVAYFDFGIEEDLKLCWNFINIRVEKIELNKVRGNRIDVMAVKTYFERLYSKTKYFLCPKMLAKIDEIEVSNIVSEPKIEDFINARKADFEIMYSLTAEEFAQMNRGIPFKDVLLEREILRKFG
jgi:hypothetical protein